jgi:cold shock CspA family protein
MLRPKPNEPQGPVVTGRITKLAVGQGHGFIRLTNGREIFFHRADVQEGVSFNDLSMGDRVTFELFEDAVSGDRAVRVRLPRAR